MKKQMVISIYAVYLVLVAYFFFVPAFINPYGKFVLGPIIFGLILMALPIKAVLKRIKQDTN